MGRDEHFMVIECRDEGKRYRLSLLLLFGERLHVNVDVPMIKRRREGGKSSRSFPTITSLFGFHENFVLK